MLYFVFNEHMVAVFVGHDPVKDEWVCQLPIFPPFQSVHDYTNNPALVQDILSKGLGMPNSFDRGKIQILSIDSWTMQAQVAGTFTSRHNNLFLVGDSAHRFPPAGGFGMNTGLQDAHNLSWKLAYVCHGYADRSLLASYSTGACSAGVGNVHSSA